MKIPKPATPCPSRRKASPFPFLRRLTAESFWVSLPIDHSYLDYIPGYTHTFMIKQAYFLSSFRTPQAYLPTYRAGSQISAESEEIHTYMPSRNLPSKDQTITRIPTRHNPVCICISSTHLPYLFISLSFRPRSLLPTSFAHYSPLIGCLIYTPSLSLPRSRITGSGPPLSRYQVPTNQPGSLFLFFRLVLSSPASFSDPTLSQPTSPFT